MFQSIGIFEESSSVEVEWDPYVVEDGEAVAFKRFDLDLSNRSSSWQRRQWREQFPFRPRFCHLGHFHFAVPETAAGRAAGRPARRAAMPAAARLLNSFLPESPGQFLFPWESQLSILIVAKALTSPRHVKWHKSTQSGEARIQRRNPNIAIPSKRGGDVITLVGLI